MSFGLVVLTTIWAIGTLGWVAYRSESTLAPSALVVTGMVCLLILAYRVSQIRRVFTVGRVVTGRIVIADKNFENDHYVIAEYRFGGRTYRGKHITERTSGSFRQGDVIELVVDPIRPSRAYIVKVFA